MVVGILINRIMLNIHQRCAQGYDKYLARIFKIIDTGVPVTNLTLIKNMDSFNYHTIT